jgi:hypothetical protein
MTPPSPSPCAKWFCRRPRMQSRRGAEIDRRRAAAKAELRRQEREQRAALAPAPAPVPIDRSAEIDQRADVLIEATGAALGQVREQLRDEIKAAADKVLLDVRAEIVELRADFAAPRNELAAVSIRSGERALGTLQQRVDKLAASCEKIVRSWNSTD